MFYGLLEKILSCSIDEQVLWFVRAILTCSMDEHVLWLLKAI